MNFKVGKYYLICCIVLVLDLLSNQIGRLFNINSRMILLFFYYLKYFGSIGLFFVAMSIKRKIDIKDKKN